MRFTEAPSNNTKVNAFLKAAVLAWLLTAAPSRADDSSSKCSAFMGEAKILQVQGKAIAYEGHKRLGKAGKGMDLSCGEKVLLGADAEAVFRMKESGSLIKIKGPGCVRFVLRPPGFDRAIVTGDDGAEGLSIRAVRGTAASLNSSEQWVKLAVNEVLPRGTVIRTGSETVVDLYDRVTHSVIRIQADSEVTVGDQVLTARGSASVHRADILAASQLVASSK